MSGNRQRIVPRRIGSVVCALLGFWLVAGAVGVHIDGLSTHHTEYMWNIPIFVVLSAVVLVIGGALLFAAWRLWRAPKRLP